MKLNIMPALRIVTALAAVWIVHLPVMAQTGGSYVSAIVPKKPVDVKEAALYDRLNTMYDAGWLAPQELAELKHDLDTIQCYEIKVRSFGMGLTGWTVAHLNAKLDGFSARLDARMTNQ